MVMRLAKDTSHPRSSVTNPNYLHNHRGFKAAISSISKSRDIATALVEKDYWIMHALYGLQAQEFGFELKGGTSLSKGYRIIERFSEDIDIKIDSSNAPFEVETNPKKAKKQHCQSRLKFYDWLATEIKIPDMTSVRDTAFDDKDYGSGGIRLHYDSKFETVTGLKEGILLEVGFDDTAPNAPCDISSWVLDYAEDKLPEITKNRAMKVPCYNPGYTFVEKLQTVSTKFKQQRESGQFGVNFMRHYYDIYQLLGNPTVQEFIGSDAYAARKDIRFRAGDEKVISKNEAFAMSDNAVRKMYEKQYDQTSALYFLAKPSFSEILSRIRANWDRM